MYKKTIIITGSSGEIGKNLISYFLKKESTKVIAIDLIQKNKSRDNIEYIQGDILDSSLFNKLHKKYIINEIYHLAAILSSKAEKNPELAQKVNIEGTVNIFDLALIQKLDKNNLIKVFFPSSIAVYNLNQNRNIKVSEQMYCNPSTVYGQHKLYCENMGIALHKYGNQLKNKIDFRCIRFPGIISTNTIPTSGTSDYIPEMIHHGLQKLDYKCFVDKKSILPFIVMPDAINGIIQLMNQDLKKLTKNVYNITGFSPSINDIYSEIIKVNMKFKLTYQIDRSRQKIVDSWPKFINDKLAQEEWGWEPKHNIRQAFDNYIFPNLCRK